MVRRVGSQTCDGVTTDIWPDGSLNWSLAICWDSINLEAGDRLSLGSPANGDGGLSSICHTGPSWRADICMGLQPWVSMSAWLAHMVKVLMLNYFLYTKYIHFYILLIMCRFSPVVTREKSCQ